MEDLRVKIKRLEAIKPRPEWQKKTKEVLLMQIKNSGSPENRWVYYYHFWQSFRLFFPSRLVLKPVGFFILILGLVFTSGIAVNAAYRSLPGDFFYPLKMVTERTQLILTAEPTKKTELELEFAGRRLEEYTKIIEEKSGSQPKVEEKAKSAVKEYKAKIEIIKIKMEELEEQAEPAQVIKVAQVVEEKTKAYQEVLDKNQKEFPATQNEVEEVLDTTQKTGFKALEIMINQSYEKETDVAREQVVSRLEEEIVATRLKIKELNQKIEAKAAVPAETSDNVESSTETKQEENKPAEGETKEEVNLINLFKEKVKIAEAAIDLAENFLASGELEGAFNKITEAQDIIKEITEEIKITAN